MAVTLLVGFSAVALTLSTASQTAVGDRVTYSGTVTGLTFYSIAPGLVPNPVPSASTGTNVVQQFLGSGSNIFCGATCTAGHHAVNVTYSFTTALAGAIELNFTLHWSTGSASAHVYLRQAVLPTSGTIVVVWDVGTSAPFLTSATVTEYQCALLSCP